MNNSSFYYKDINRLQRAVPYLLIKNFHLRLPFYDVPKSGAGGLVTSVEDLSPFLIAHMNNGTYKGVRILKNSTVKIMHTIYCENAGSGNMFFSYGFGWMFYNINGTNFQGHDGDIPGFAARMVFNDKNKTGIIFIFNRSRRYVNDEDLELSDELIELLFAKSKELS